MANQRQLKSAVSKWLDLHRVGLVLVVVLASPLGVGAEDQQNQAATAKETKPKATTVEAETADKPPQGLFKRMRQRRDERKYKQLKQALDKYNTPISEPPNESSSTQDSGNATAADDATVAPAEPKSKATRIDKAD